MKVFMIGGAAAHAALLARHLPAGPEIVPLPAEAAVSSAFDDRIGPQDAVISLRLRRENGATPAFRLLHLPGAGSDGVDFASLDPGTTVCNVFEHEVPIAEFVFAALLDWEIRLPALRARFSPKTWSDAYRARVPHGEIAGRTLGILGFGRIGRAVATRAAAFGVRTLALDRKGPAAGGPADEILGPGDLSRLLAQSDYLVVACPLTEATRHLIGAAAFAAMKRSAILVNVSRAEVVEEAALFAALSNRTIAGAYLDVWYRYPTGSDDRVAPSAFPFHTLENAVCTPHSCAWTDQLMPRRYAFIARNLMRLMRSEPLENVIRAPAGAAASGSCP